ncbi:hypothetical protein MOUN0_M07492 [Monosporozyma unispora]
MPPFLHHMWLSELFYWGYVMSPLRYSFHCQLNFIKVWDGIYFDIVLVNLFLC